MNKWQWAGKLLAIGATVLLLSIALFRINFLVSERQQSQREAVASVQQSQAGAQTVVGPVLNRLCVETWEVSSGEGKERRTELKRVEHAMHATPTQLRVDASTTADPRYRGLFKVNGYVAKMNLLASWSSLSPLQPKRVQPRSTMACEPATMWLAASDVRGLRSAQASVDGQVLPVQPGTRHDAHPQGLHVVLATFDALGNVPDQALTAQVEVDLLGTQQLAIVPAADATTWQLKSDWPHPSFGGRFLPNRREVREQGFDANLDAQCAGHVGAARRGRGRRQHVRRA